ncbi:MAG: diacylglycerol/lipid kinase family protein [Eubacteriales bacterium]
MKKLLLIVNPRAGKAQVKNHLLSIIDQFNGAGYEVTVHVTQAQGDATQVVMERAMQYNLLVCSGGDGTLSEIIHGLMKLPSPPPFGYIPAGTTNDFASSLGLARDMGVAAQAIIHGVPFALDVGKFEEKYFTYIAAFGAFTDVAYETSQQEKNDLGHLAYVLEGIKRLGSLHSYPLVITHDGERLEGDFLFGMVTNSTSVGGFKGLNGKDVLLDDGVFEAVFIRDPKNLGDLQGILTSLVTQGGNSEHVMSFKARQLTIQSGEEVPWTLDGEYGGTYRAVAIHNIQRAVTVLR